MPENPLEDKPLVLVVEDNVRNQRLLEMVLKNHFRLAFAEDGEQALAQVSELLPNLVLLDVQLPKIDGMEVARRLKANDRTRAIPLVAVTSYAMDEERERILEAGCDGHLKKPVDTRTLAEEVRRYLKD